MKFSTILATAASAALFTSTSAAACTAATALQEIPEWAVEGTINITATVMEYSIAYAVGHAIGESLTDEEAKELQKELEELKKSLSKRQVTAAFECKGDEKCYNLFEEEVICISDSAKTMRDNDGYVFNITNGDYTLKSGTKGNIYTSPEALIKDFEAVISASAKPALASATAKANPPQNVSGAVGLKVGGLAIVGFVGAVVAAVL